MVPSPAAGPGPWRRAQRAFSCAFTCAAVLALSAACGGDNDPGRGDLVELVEVAALPKASIDQSTAAAGLQALAGPARCDVTLSQLVYRTVGPRGEDGIPVSAALLVPGGADCSGPYPLVAYAKGTDLIRSRTLASASDPETGVLIGMLAARGYVVVAPDYIGFARSDYPYHPFLEADSEAATIVDAIRAARGGLFSRGVATADDVLLTGYSQGGHASMAAQRLIERDRARDLRLAAAGHASGPYDLTGTFLVGLSLLPAGSGGSTVFFPYAVTGYQKAYGNLYATASDYFKPPFAGSIEGLLPGAASAGELVRTGRLPALLGDLITPRVTADLQDPASGLRQALDRNTLLGWAPQAPTLLCGGARDPVVDFRNARQAQAAFQGRGAAVAVVDVEQVPAFAPLFPPSLTPEQQAAYHGSTVGPLCLKTVRDELFEPVRTRLLQPVAGLSVLVAR